MPRTPFSNYRRQVRSHLVIHYEWPKEAAVIAIRNLREIMYRSFSDNIPPRVVAYSIHEKVRSNA